MGGVLLSEAWLRRELNLDGIFTSGGREGAHLLIPAEEEDALFAWRKQQTLKISLARGDSLLPARYTHFLPPPPTPRRPPKAQAGAAAAAAAATQQRAGPREKVALGVIDVSRSRPRGRRSGGAAARRPKVKRERLSAAPGGCE